MDRKKKNIFSFSQKNINSEQSVKWDDGFVPCPGASSSSVYTMVSQCIHKEH